MLTRLHANATTTPRTRAEIQASTEPVAVLAKRYGVSETTIRRWRSRATTQDGSHVRHNLGQATTPLDEAIIAELRTMAGLSLDDITEVMNRCVHPGLSRGSVWTALRRLGLSGRRGQSARAAAQPFRDAPFGYVHVDLKHLGKLGGRGEFVFAALERATRFAWIEVLPDRRAETVAGAMARFLAAFPGRVHTVLTDRAIEPPLVRGPMARGSEFTDRFGGDVGQRRGRPSGRHAFDRLCAAQGIEHRLTRPYTPRTNGMVERFNRRIAEAIAGHPRFRGGTNLRATFASRAERAAYLQDFVEAYNRTRLRCLGYRAPMELLNNQLGDNTQSGARRSPGREPADNPSAFALTRSSRRPCATQCVAFAGSAARFRRPRARSGSLQGRTPQEPRSLAPSP